MKNKLIPSLAIALAITGTFPQTTLAADPSPGANPRGIGFLPLDFYPKHREELGLSDDQVRAMQKIVEGMREPGEKLESQMRDRVRALQEAMGQNPVDVKTATERFVAVMQAENELKSLQFRTRLELRTVLRPEQYEKARGMAARAQSSRESASSGGLHEKLRQVRERIGKRSGGNPPREVIEKLEQIEQLAKGGRAAEAEQQLDSLLHHLSSAQKSGHPEKGEMRQQFAKMEEALKNTTDPEQREQIQQRMRKLREEQGGAGKAREGARREGGEMRQQFAKMEEALKNTTDPEQREQIQQRMRKLREAQGGAGKAREGAGREGGGMERQMHRIAEAAEQTTNPEVREKLQGALRKLREAAESGNQEVVRDILTTIKPMLQGDRE